MSLFLSVILVIFLPVANEMVNHFLCALSWNRQQYFERFISISPYVQWKRQSVANDRNGFDGRNTSLSMSFVLFLIHGHKVLCCLEVSFSLHCIIHNYLWLFIEAIINLRVLMSFCLACMRNFQCESLLFATIAVAVTFDK